MAAYSSGAHLNRVCLRGPAEALILLGAAKRRAAEMAMNLDRLLLQTRRHWQAELALHFARGPSAGRLSGEMSLTAGSTTCCWSRVTGSIDGTAGVRYPAQDEP